MMKTILFVFLLSCLLSGVLFLPAGYSKSLTNDNTKPKINQLSQSIEIEIESDEELHEEVLRALPKPPADFSWKIFKGVAFLKPNKWNEFSKMDTYSTSIESVPESGSFETGFTVQIFHEIDKRHHIPPIVLAVTLIKQIESQNDNKKIFVNANKHNNGVETIVYKYKNSPKGLKPIIVHKYFQINEKSQYVNLFTFETTEENWDKYWEQYGEIILGKVACFYTPNLK